MYDSENVYVKEQKEYRHPPRGCLSTIFGSMMTLVNRSEEPFVSIIGISKSVETLPISCGFCTTG